MPNIIVHQENLISASSDFEAIQLWLSVTTNGSPNTFISYQKESSRLIVWLSENKLNLNDLKLEHLIAFAQFLQSPPLSMIGSPRPRSHPDWKPFAKPLSPRSAYYTMTVIGGLLGFLEDSKYLKNNPMPLFIRVSRNSALKSAKKVARRKPIESDIQTIIKNYLLRCEGDIEIMRGRWLVSLFIYSGLRLSEVASLKMKNFVNEKGNWYISVTGKGNKQRMIAIPKIVMEELAIYRKFLGLNAIPQKEDIFVIGNKKNGCGLTSRGLSLALHRFLLKIETDLNINSIAKVHPHLFRHTAATSWLVNGASLADVRDQLGHSSISTTSLYVTPDNQQRHKSIERAS